MTPIDVKGLRVLVGVLGALLLASASLILLQAERLWAATGPQPSPASAIGRAVPEIEGYTLDGQRVSHRLRDGLPTVVYYFTPSCIWCERNWDNLNALTRGTQGRFRILAVTAKRNVVGDLAARQVQAEVIEGVSTPVLASFGFRSAPHLVAISPDGVLTAEWLGAPTPRLQRQIETAFDVLLPGLSPPALRQLPTQ